MPDVCLMFTATYHDPSCCEVLLVLRLGTMLISFCFGGISEANYVHLVTYYVQSFDGVMLHLNGNIQLLNRERVIG
uniref:Uncharacterized protein n=1 Tax=Physcomitrium patens TaxID=3218 RepID=A0A7I3ZLH5_PHYPA